MMLKRIHITHFRSVVDSEDFDVVPVTCLVGKNEAGKSALLLALAALNPNEATPVTLDRERDYPRRNLVRYEHMHDGTEAKVVTTTWELDEAEIHEIAEDVGEHVLKSPLVKVSRRYGTEIEVDAQIDYTASVKHHYRLFALSAPEQSVLKSPETVDRLIERLRDLGSPTEKHVKLRDYLAEKAMSTHA